MKIKTILLAVLVISVFLVGCQKPSTAGYATYNQQQQQGQYVGGGCGVAPQAGYDDVSVDTLDSADSAL